MKKLTSNIIRVIYILSTIIIVPVACIKIYEIISGSASVDPHLRNMLDGIFWTAFAVHYLCSWYINKQKRINKAY